MKKIIYGESNCRKIKIKKKIIKIERLKEKTKNKYDDLVKQRLQQIDGY